MRRALVVLVCLTLAACGDPAGTDGDLTGGWVAHPSVTYAPPGTGACLAGAGVTAFEPVTAVLRAVDCAQPHTVEVVASAVLPDGPSPPPWDSDASRAAFAACDKAATAYVGGDWREGRLFPVFSTPRDAVWNGGGRQYLCGVAEAADDMFTPLERTGSVKNGLTGDRPLALTCVVLTGGDVTAKGFYGSVSGVRPVGCDQPHDTEFVGSWTAPAGDHPPQLRLQELANDACFPKIAQFLGITTTQLYERGDIYTFWTGLTASQWKIGDRTAHCYLNTSSRTPMKGSLRGHGLKALPAG